MSKESDYIWFDGKLIRESEVRISVRSHSLHYGTAVFEGMRAYYNNDDLRIFRLKDHIRRLLESAKMVHLETPLTLDVLADGTKELLRTNNFRVSVYIRPIVFAGEGGISLDFTKHVKHAAIFAFPFSAYFDRSGLRVCVSSWRKISSNSVIPRAKAAANYLNSCLATMEAKAAGYDEAVLLDEDGRVSEGPGENIFIVRNGVIITPPTYSRILEGITRDTVITLAREKGFRVEERPMDRSELYTAEEVFFSGTASEIEPILEIDGLKVQAGKPGEVTQELKKTYSKVVGGSPGLHSDWLTSIYGAPDHRSQTGVSPDGSRSQTEMHDNKERRWSSSSRQLNDGL